MSARLSVKEWVAERLGNSERIAATKPEGADRERWLEDAEYFRAILTVLTAESAPPDADAEERSRSR